VLFAGGGYGCEGTDQGRYLYVLNLEDGSVYEMVGPILDDASAVIDGNALVAQPVLVNHHQPGMSDGKDYVSRAYIGDLQGFVYKLDCSNPNSASWTFNEFYALGLDQPITAPVALILGFLQDRVYVMVGTGGDYRVLSQGRRFKFAALIDDDPDGFNTPGQPVQIPSGGDFIIDLPQDERIYVAPVTANLASGGGVVYFASSRVVLDNVACAGKFFSTLFAFEATTGLAAFDLDPATGGENTQVDLGEGKVTGLYHRDSHLYVSKSGSLSLAGETEVRGSDEFPPPPVQAGTIQIEAKNFRFSVF
jgi:hypothetical protein